ncbi:MAG: MFS transporter [Candidatus Nanopelagicales bacterium]
MTTTIPELDVPAIQRRTVGVLSISQIFGGIAVAGSVAAGSLIAASVSGSEAVAGLAQTFGVLGAALLALPLARVALSKGRRASLALGYGMGAVGALVVIAGALWLNIVLVLLGCLLVGVASASGYQARYAAVDLAQDDKRGRQLSYVVWAATIGAVLGPNLLEPAGWLGISLGLPQLAGPYVVTAITLAIAVLVLLTFLRPDPYILAADMRAKVDAEAKREVAKPRLRDGIAHLRGNRGALLGMSAIAIGHVAMVMVMVMTPIHMAHVDVTLTLIGLVISVHVAGMYAFSPIVGRSVDRYGPIPVIVAGILNLLASCLLAGLAAGDQVILLGIGLLLLGIGWSCTLIAGSTLLVDDVGPVERPSVQGLSDLVMNGAGAVGGAVAGLVVAFSSYAVLCAVAAVPVLGLALLVMAWRNVAMSSRNTGV